jgi:hypothetical protein
MSFYTGLVYYRPCAPPPVTADDLSRFIARIRDTGTLADSGFGSLNVKFGQSIDQDDERTYWEEPTVPGIFELHEIEWDLCRRDRPTVEQIIASLASDQRRVYRAHVGLGMPIDDVRLPITRKNSPENKINFFPDKLSIAIGPIECFRLGSDCLHHVGWIGVSLSGGGYLYPWTFRELVKRAEASPAIQRIMEACRAHWPVPAEPPEPRFVAARKEFSDFWPYDDVDRPWDWYWGLQEG